MSCIGSGVACFIGTPTCFCLLLTHIYEISLSQGTRAGVFPPFLWGSISLPRTTFPSWLSATSIRSIHRWSTMGHSFSRQPWGEHASPPPWIPLLSTPRHTPKSSPALSRLGRSSSQNTSAPVAVYHSRCPSEYAARNVPNASAIFLLCRCYCRPSSLARIDTWRAVSFVKSISTGSPEGAVGPPGLDIAVSGSKRYIMSYFYICRQRNARLRSARVCEKPRLRSAHPSRLRRSVHLDYVAHTSTRQGRKPTDWWS